MSRPFKASIASLQWYPACREDHWTTFRIALDIHRPENKEVQLGSLGNSGNWWNFVNSWRLGPWLLRLRAVDLWEPLLVSMEDLLGIPRNTEARKLANHVPSRPSLNHVEPFLVLRRLLVLYFYMELMWDCSILPSSLQSSSLRTFKSVCKLKRMGCSAVPALLPLLPLSCLTSWSEKHSRKTCQERSVPPWDRAFQRSASTWWRRRCQSFHPIMYGKNGNLKWLNSSMSSSEMQEIAWQIDNYKLHQIALSSISDAHWRIPRKA